MGSTEGFGGSTASAVQPMNDQIVFSASGNATGNYDGTGGVYKSTNSGNNWAQVLSVYVSANDKQAYGGQRKMGNAMDIHRQKPDVVYIETQSNCLYRSLTQGNSGWTKIVSIPNCEGRYKETGCRQVFGIDSRKKFNCLCIGL